MTECRSYSRHGLHTLQARVKVAGLQALDRRTATARALLHWRSELIADLGGVEQRYPGPDHVTIAWALGTPRELMIEQLTRFAREVIRAFPR